MTVELVRQAIEKRGFIASLNTDGSSFTVLDAQSNEVPWVTFTVSKSGKINNTAFRSYHPPKIEGQNEHETAVIYADLYNAAKGKPGLADKAVALLQVTPAPANTVLQQSAVLATV